MSQENPPNPPQFIPPQPPVLPHVAAAPLILPTSPIPPTQPYTVLWALAEHYLKTATRLAATTTPVAPQQLYNHVVAAVRCLEAVLVSGVLPLKVEVKTRYRLAEVLRLYTDNATEAEMHLQKATLLIQKTNDVSMYEYRFMIKDLQCTIYQSDVNGAAKTVKNLLKQAAGEALGLGMPKWYYHFTRRRADVLVLDGDMKGCYSAIMGGVEEANKRGDLEMKAVLLLSLAYHALTSRQDVMVTDALSHLQKHFESPPATSSSQSDPTITITATNTTTPPQLHITNHHLHLYHNIITLLHLLHQGKVKESLPLLTSLHGRLESPQTASDTEIDRGITIIPVRQADGREQERVSVRLLDRAKLFALVFLVSGIVHKPGDGFKAKKHFVEGIKVVDKELSSIPACPSIPEMIQSRNWFLELKIVLLRHIAEVCIMRSEFSEALRALIKLREYTHTYPYLSTPHLAPQALSWAMFHQSLGQRDRAFTYYQRAIATGDVDVGILAKCHLCLMGAEGEMQEEVRKVIEERRGEVGKAVLGLMKGVGCLSRGDIRLTKLTILETIKTSDILSCTHLRFLSLTLLGTLFSTIDPEQAEKMYFTAQNMARKAGSPAIANVCAEQLIQKAVRAGNAEKAGKLKEARDGYVDKLRERVTEGWKGVVDWEKGVVSGGSQ